MVHGEDTKKAFGSGRAHLVYGLNEADQLVHISIAARGLACRCRCPSCGDRLIARTKDDHRVPHFAHHNREAFSGGPETALHLLAKELFTADPNLFLPPRLGLDNSGDIAMRPGQEVATTFVRLEHSGPGRIVPDLYISVAGHDLFVEIAVTHPCDGAKIMLIKEYGVPAIEIDLSRLARDAAPDVVAEAVLQSAHRRWLYHPGIDAADAKYRADEELRQAELERRRDVALAKHQGRVAETASLYRQAVIDVARMQANVPRLKELHVVGLDKNVGIDIPGYACFATPPSVWQAKVLAEVFHDRRLGNEVRKAIPITGHLEKEASCDQHFDGFIVTLRRTSLLSSQPSRLLGRRSKVIWSTWSTRGFL